VGRSEIPFRFFTDAGTLTEDDTGMPAKLPQTDERSFTAEQCRALVERVASSVELRRASRLRAFLLYVCDQTLNHGATVIHEQEIGAAVFERPDGYDTSIDNIVRVNATELRKRLEHFFAEEGRNEELMLEIQRGTYTPTFHKRPVSESVSPSPPASAVREGIELASAAPAIEAAPAHGTEAEPAVEVSPPAGSWDRLRLWQGLCLLLLASCGALAWQVHSLAVKAQPWPRDPAIRAFWGEFPDAGDETDILLADTSFAVAEDIMQRQVALPDYLNYNYKHMADDPALPAVRRDDLARVLERNNGSIADFQVAAQILALDKDRHRFTLESSRSYSPEAAKRHSLILIGSRQSNPWVSLFADNMNFDLEYDSAARRPYVVNRAPQPGEALQYPGAEGAKPAGTGYAVIAFMPDLSGKGRTLVIEGTDSQATGAAGDFITNEDSLAQLEKKFPAGTIPYFEVLLRTVQLSGTPLHGEVIAYRIYPAGSHRQTITPGADGN
jgi:hypothetical protein